MGEVDIRFVNAARQLKIDIENWHQLWTKFSPGQVDITLVTAAWQLDIGKLTLDFSVKRDKNRLAWFLIVKCFEFRILIILWEQ